MKHFMCSSADDPIELIKCRTKVIYSFNEKRTANYKIKKQEQTRSKLILRHPKNKKIKEVCAAGQFKHLSKIAT